MIDCRLELHIHSVVSADASLEMIPPFIVEKALQEGINVIALTDHNTGANVPALMEAARGTGLTVIAGMELETEEEVHVLCLFDSLEQLQSFEKIVDARIPNYKNNEAFFGNQLVVDKDGNFIRKDERLLQTATSLSLIETSQQVEALGGLLILAHVEREQSGILPRLGTIPPELKNALVEVSHYTDLEKVLQEWPILEGIPIITNGDAHDLDGIMGNICVQIEEITLANIARAIREQAK